MDFMEEDSIDLLGLAKALWKNILVIALVAVLAGGAAFGYTAFMMRPTYQATVSLYVNNSAISLGSTKVTVSGAELSTSSSLVNVYLYILKSRTTMEEVIEKADLSYTPQALLGMVSAKGVNSTGAFEVTVTTGNPAEAEKIANTIAEVLPLRIADIVDGSTVRIVDYAIIPSRRSGPNVAGNTTKGMLAGALLGAACVAAVFLLDGRSKSMVKSADDLRAMYPDLQVLAMIPDLRVSDKKNGYYSAYTAYYGTPKKKEGTGDGGKQRA